MKLSVAQDEGDSVHIALAGQCTGRELSGIQDPLIDLLGPDCYRRKVRIDLSETSYLDSGGINWLLTCHKRTKQSGGSLTIARPHPVVLNVLRVLKLDKVFHMEGSQAEGVA